LPLLLHAPRLRLARVRLAEVLLELEGAERVALPYPSDLERVLNLYAQGLVGWRRVVEEARERMPGYFRSWLWSEEPLLRALPLLGAKVRCYMPSSKDYFSRASELAVLAFRVRVTGKVDIEEWRKLLGSGAAAPPAEHVVVASRPPGGGLGVDVWRLPYPPSEVLSSSNLSEEAVREYVNYVFTYIVHSKNIDEAYLRWLEERKGLRVPELWKLLEMSYRRSKELNSGAEQV